jgi:cytochrome d ubiquinol oxidase subunit II
LGLFGLSYLGLGISLYPFVVPRTVTIWQAASPDSTLGFLLVGAAILLPIIIAYTAYAYWIFRGKVGKTGYHA